MEELLGRLSHDDLKAFMRDACMQDDKFGQLFAAKHVHLLSPESGELYTRQLRSLIKAFSDRSGFVDRRNAGRLGGIIREMAGKARAGIAKGEIQRAMFAATAIIGEMADVISCDADDSDGQIGRGMEEAFGVLEVLVGSELTAVQHDELFGWLLSLFENGTLHGWDWHFTALHLGIRLVETAREKERVKSALERIKPNGKGRDPGYDRTRELMLERIGKTEGSQAAVRFMEGNISNPRFRAALIEKALDVKDYQKAGKLALEGIARDEKSDPRQAAEWRNYLLTVCRRRGDTESAVRLARYAYIHSNGRHHPLKYYYELMKSLVPGEQWPAYRSALVGELEKECAGECYDRVSRLYIWESQWEELLGLLRQHATFERVAGAERYLADMYSNEMACLYRELVLDYLERYMGRAHYRTACRYIRRMIKLGARDAAGKLVRELKTIYPARRSLLKELSRV